MGRRIWVIPEGTKIDEQILQEATANNCPEIAVGIPPALESSVSLKQLPFAYEEPMLPVPPPARNLAVEIDDLKTRIEKLEKK